MEIAVYVCLGFMLVSAVTAVRSNGLIGAAIALAITSAASGVLMYLLGASWAAIFEVSVCSGLVTVILISAVSLSNGDHEEGAPENQDRKRTKHLPVILIVVGGALLAIAAIVGFSVGDAAAQGAATFSETLWESCQVDIWGQIIVLVTGTAAIVVFFKESENQ